MHAPTAKHDPDRADRMPFLTLLRALACLMVVCYHLGGSFLDAHHARWWPVTTLRGAVLTPLGLTGNTAFVGVMIFFLVSGYLITHVALRESRKTFALKRVLRIAPPLLVATGVALALHLARLYQPAATWTPGQIASTASLWANLATDPVAQGILGVTWTLLIECLFYLIMWALVPLLQRWPAATITLLLPALLWGLWLALAEGAAQGVVPTPLARAGNFLAFVPCLLIGQALYAVTRRLIRPAVFVALLLVDAASFTAAFTRFHGTRATATLTDFLLALAWAVPFFVLALLVNHWLRLPRGVTLLGDASYSLYLLHLPVGLPLVAILYRDHAALGGFTIPFVVAVTASLLAAVAAWWAVERPSQRVARWLVRPGRPHAATTAPA